MQTFMQVLIAPATERQFADGGPEPVIEVDVAGRGSRTMTKRA
jgi:hypothetical protein